MTGIDYRTELNILSDKNHNVMHKFVPLLCENNAYTSQSEKNIFITENSKIIFE
jgi:hypothetical protein